MGRAARYGDGIGMDVLIRAWSFTTLALPPPPQPGGTAADDERAWPLLLTAGLTLAALALFALGVAVGRALSARGARRPVDTPLVRIERWRDGEAVVLGYAIGETATVALREHLVRLRTDRVPGTVVLIEPLSDRIVALRPIDEEPAPLRKSSPARPAPPTIARRRDAATPVIPRA